MNERRWFQIHHSTLMLVVFWCATMQLLSHKGMSLDAGTTTRDGWTIKQMGFPLRSFEEIHGAIDGEKVLLAQSYPGNVIIDLLFWIASTFALGFASEYLIRRRENRLP